ncbi:MAG: hypothetical protein H0V66_08990, partial [Bdellovibrionales bacterium]|nr:hypothetical protein [Bdellovibrionales bacterium]
YGSGRIRIFEEQAFKIDPAWKLPDQAGAKEKISQQIINDKNFRYQWLKDNGLLTKTPSAPAGQMVSGSEILTYQKNQWQFKDSAGEIWTFNKAGQLVGMSIPGSGEWQISSKDNRPVTLKKKDRTYVIAYDSNNLVSKIEFKKTKLAYQFQKGFLQESTDSNGQKYTYAYSSLNQLESIKGPKTHFSFDYQAHTGRIFKAVENGANANYSYDVKIFSDSEVSTTTIKDGKGEHKVEYTYKTGENGRYLAKLREIHGTQVTETQFNFNRQPTKILAPGSTQDISYDANGRILEIRRGEEVTSKVVRDNQSGKITEIRDRNQLRKFSYTSQGKISAVALSDGTILSFTYNPDGFIQTADLKDLNGLSEGLLTPVYKGQTVTDVLIDGKRPVNSNDKLRAVRFYQVINEATALPKY